MDIGGATKAEHEAIVSLWRRCGLVEQLDQARADLRRADAGACSEILVGRIDGRVRAAALIGFDGHRAWAYYVAVDPEMQRAGLGRELMTAAADWARSRGAPKLMLLVADDNRKVLDFYQALGFQPRPFEPLALILDKP